jgi:transcription initiation factor TFIIA small subunit
MAYQMYRSTTLGDALQKTLDEFIQVPFSCNSSIRPPIQDGQITPQLALKVMTTFDKAINKALSQRAKNKTIFKAGKLRTYRFCDNVWTFVMEDVEFRDSKQLGVIERVKFVACDGRAANAT